MASQSNYHRNPPCPRLSYPPIDSRHRLGLGEKLEPQQPVEIDLTHNRTLPRPLLSNVWDDGTPIRNGNQTSLAHWLSSPDGPWTEKILLGIDLASVPPYNVPNYTFVPDNIEGPLIEWYTSDGPWIPKGVSEVGPNERELGQRIFNRIPMKPGPRSGHGTLNTRGSPNTKCKFKRTENQRKALRVKIRGVEHLACPDSGSEENIMSRAITIARGLKIRRRLKDIKNFELGNGKHVTSIGRVRASVELRGNSLGRKKRWFYIFETCPVPIVLGMPFLKETEILSKNRHLLEDCPIELCNISSLLWIGSPRQGIRCSLDGHDLAAVADTGSDLNLISLKCAKREGFSIDRRREARRRIRVGDGSETETIGQVYVYNLSLDWRKEGTVLPRLHFATDDVPGSDGSFDPSDSETDDDDPTSFGAIFHVLPNLPCDIIFGRSLLEQTDAFNLCPAFKDCPSTPSISDLDEPLTFKVFRVLISLGPVSINLPISRRKRRRSAVQADGRERHNDARHAEMFRRSRVEDEIMLLPFAEQDTARAEETKKKIEWDREHAMCSYCNPV